MLHTEHLKLSLWPPGFKQAPGTQQTEGHSKQFLFWNGQAPLPAVPARGPLPWCLGEVLDLFLQLLPSPSLMVITLHAEAGYHSWVIFAPWLLHTCKISACAPSTEAKQILIQLFCAVPAAGFLQPGPDITLYIAKQFLSQQPLPTRITGERYCRQKHDAIENHCQQFHLYQAGTTAIKYGKTSFSQHL